MPTEILLYQVLLTCVRRYGIHRDRWINVSICN